ncbi:MAG: hypothetical protein ACXVR1_10115 [Solirubrobacteraceae bacterium]
MNTHSMRIQSGGHRPQVASRRTRVRRRSAAALAPAPDHAAAPVAASPARLDAKRQEGGARILRRWSVADLIARAAGTPRAIA